MQSQALTVLSRFTDQSVGDMAKVAERYPFAIPPFIMRRVEQGTYSTRALRQFSPDARELLDIGGYSADPTGEVDLRPAPAVLKTYDNRLALIVTYQCLIYCRFCFRKSAVGFSENHVDDEALSAALAYLREHTEIEDVLLSGGDPLAVPNKRLLPFLQRLIDIEHIKAVRIDSRALSAHPDRIDDELLRFLEANNQFWFYAHMNHPDDIDHPEVLAAVRRLLSARVPIMNQSVILAGVNDDPETMTRLMRLCYLNKVLPYNLYVLDRVKGGAHFDVPTNRVLEIYQALSALSGPAQPLLVYVDARSRKHRAVYDPAFDLKTFLDARSAQ
jgi:KamA family protein